MPTIFPRATDSFQAVTYPVGPTISGAIVTAGSPGNTKGSYTEFVAATPFASNLVQVHCHATPVAVSGRRHMVDLAVGPTGQETVVLANLIFEGPGAGTTLAATVTIVLPLDIPAGVRLVARSQCSVASNTIELSITLIRSGQRPGIFSWTTYGANTVDSGGASVDPGGSVNTKGLYTELTASTSVDHHALVAVFTNGGNSAPTSVHWAVDIARGSAGVETVILPDVRLTGHPNAIPQPGTVWIPVFIPAGTRLAVRASASTIDATDRLFDVILLGGAAPPESPDGLSWAPLSVLAGAGLSLVRAVASGSSPVGTG